MTLTCFQAFDWISGLAKEVWVSEHVLVLHNEPKHGHLWIENIKVKALVPVRIQTVVHCSQENKKNTQYTMKHWKSLSNMNTESNSKNTLSLLKVLNQMVLKSQYS